MTSIFLKVTGAHAEALVTGPLTSGMVGIPVTMEYDDAWEGLTKNLVCRCARGTDDGEQRTILNVEHSAVVAHEVMQAGMHLYLGVEGVSADGALVIPTVWALCGVIESGANAGSELSAEPTLSVWEQLQAEIGQVRQNALTQEQAAEIQAGVQATAVYAGRAEAAAKRAEEAVSSVQGGGMTQAQINALHGMFRVCLYDDSKNVSGAIAAFETAFGIGGGEAPDEPEEPGVATYSVVYELVNVSSGNSVASVPHGAAYAAVLTAAGGYTLDGAAVSVTMGGVDITATAYSGGTVSIGAVTGDISIFASAVQIGQDIEAVLPTDGLLGYFDLRNAPAASGNGSTGYYIPATTGNGRMYAWHSSSAGNEYGMDAKGDFCAGAAYTSHDFGTESTWIIKSYCDVSQTVRGFAKYITPTNFGGNLAPTYNTSDGTATAAEQNLGKKGGYHDTVITVSGSLLRVYVNAEKVAEYNGADIAGFVSWYSKAAPNDSWANNAAQKVTTALAFYDRALSETEIVEAVEYLKTLEVTA